MEEKKEKIKDKKGNLLMTKTDELFDFMEEELKNKLDLLLPNRYKEEESSKFTNFVEEVSGETNTEEFAPDFEDDKMDDLFSVDKSSTKKKK